MEAARIVRVPDHLVDGVQEWDRRTDDDDVRGVSARQREATGRWSWTVSVSAAQLWREEPAEGELRRAVAASIASVAGVAEVAEEDRGVWILTGDPSGEELVRAVGDAVDDIAASTGAGSSRDSVSER